MLIIFHHQRLLSKEELPHDLIQNGKTSLSVPRTRWDWAFNQPDLWSLLKNLKFVKTFASINLVLKAYLWHVDETDYLLGHEEVLEDFANDVPLSVSYRYDPVTQFLSYIDNGNFSVNVVLADVPLILHQRLQVNLSFFPLLRKVFT